MTLMHLAWMKQNISVTTSVSDVCVCVSVCVVCICVGVPADVWGQVEASRGCCMYCFVFFCLISLRQGLSLTLDLGYRPARPVSVAGLDHNPLQQCNLEETGTFKNPLHRDFLHGVCDWSAGLLFIMVMFFHLHHLQGLWMGDICTVFVIFHLGKS